MKSIRVSDGNQFSWGETIVLERRFAPMIARLEQQAQVAPDAYRWKVVGAGLLGYVVHGGVLLLFAGLTLAIVALVVESGSINAVEIKLGLVFGAIAFALLRSLWVSRTPPEGVAVTAIEAPALHATISRIQNETGGQKLDDVRITDQLNAAITQDARFLVFGSWNTLYLGLPLLLAMREEEIEAVIAHEFGHFAGRHGKTSGFAYRLRLRWAQVAEHLSSGIVAGLLRRFFQWYGPWFASYSFVLARQQEYEADRISAQVVGTRSAANALMRVSAQADLAEAAWENLWARMADDSAPPASPYRELAVTLAQGSVTAQASIERALNTPADLHDTHPSLAQRIAALGEAATAPPPLGDAAARMLLGETADHLLDRFDRDWHEWADEIWAESHEARLAARAEWQSLAGSIADGDSGRAALFRYAELTEGFEGASAGAAAYHAVLNHYPNDLEARFKYGDALLNARNDDGVQVLVESSEADATLRPYIYHRIMEFLTDAGRGDEARGYSALLEQAEQDAARASSELSAIDESAILAPLDDHLREQVAALCGEVPGIATLRVALRELALSAQPQIIVMFVARDSAAATEVLDSLLERLQPLGNVLGVEKSWRRAWLTRKIDAVPGSLLKG